MESTGAEPALQATAQAPPRPAAPDWQRWAELGLVVLIAIVPLILRAVASLSHPQAGDTLALHFRMSYAILEQVSSLLLVFYFLSRRGQGIKALGLTFDRWTDLLRAVGVAVGGLFVSAFLSSLVRSLSWPLTGHMPDMRDPRVIFAGVPLGWFVIYAIISSIFEETIVRGYVTSEMISLSCPVWFSTVTSIVLQTSYHVYYGVGGALAVSGMFIVSGIYFARSRRLLPVILGHMAVDIFTIWLRFRH